MVQAKQENPGSQFADDSMRFQYSKDEGADVPLPAMTSACATFDASATYNTVTTSPFGISHAQMAGAPSVIATPVATCSASAAKGSRGSSTASSCDAATVSQRKSASTGDT